MAGPRRQFSLVETEPEVSEALRDHVGGVRPSASGRAPSFREVARCPRECEHSSGVAVLCGAAAPSSRVPPVPGGGAAAEVRIRVYVCHTF